MSELEKQLFNCLLELLTQVREDCPQEYRTRHLQTAMDDANDLIIDTQVKQGRMKL
jgi:hypothetical protein